MQGRRVTQRLRLSLVIPAHNEAATIRRCLSVLASDPLADSCEVVVATNGCTDDTAAVAHGFAEAFGVLRVLELDAASKSAALNAGDAVATAFPRIYLDADIELDDAAMAGLLETLSTVEPRVSSPQIRFDLSGASWVVRRFYDAYTRTPYVESGLIGLGVYGLSEAGRRRFETFPDLTGDDLFVQRLFSDSERVTSPGTFVVRTPRTTPDLVRVRTRTSQGNAQLAGVGTGEVDATRTTSYTLRALAQLAIRDLRRAPAVAVYVAVMAAARANARRVSNDTWLRDDSSRHNDVGVELHGEGSGS